MNKPTLIGLQFFAMLLNCSWLDLRRAPAGGCLRHRQRTPRASGRLRDDFRLQGCLRLYLSWHRHRRGQPMTIFRERPGRLESVRSIPTGSAHPPPAVKNQRAGTGRTLHRAHLSSQLLCVRRFSSSPSRMHLMHIACKKFSTFRPQTGQRSAI